MKKLLILLVISAMLSGTAFAYVVEERVAGVTKSSYDVSDLLDIKEIAGRDIYVDGEVFTNENWKDFNKQFDPMLKAFALVVLDEFNVLRVNAGLAPRTTAQLVGAVKNKMN